MTELLPWRKLKSEARSTLIAFIDKHKDFPFSPVFANEDATIRQWASGRRLLLGFLEGEGYLMVERSDAGDAVVYRLTSKGYAFATKSPLEEFIEKYQHQLWYDAIKGVISAVIPTIIIGLTFSFVVEFVKLLMHRFFDY
jgi:hypothetical protein